MIQIRRILVGCIGILGPLVAFHSERLFHPAPWLLLVNVLIVQWTLPFVSRTELKQAKDDRRSGILILIGGNLVALAPLLEFSLRETLYPLPFSPWVWGGAGALTLGTALRVWAIKTLGAAFTGLVQTQSDQRLIRSGPYRWMRHPSYSAMVAAFLGEAALFQSVWGLALTLSAMIPIYLYRIHVEEAALVRHFGDGYSDYRRATWALVPFIF